MALVLLGQVAFCRPLYGGPAAPPPPSGGGAAVSSIGGMAWWPSHVLGYMYCPRVI